MQNPSEPISAVSGDLSPYTYYLLKCLAEECNELAFNLIKTDRFGLSPNRIDGKKYNNKLEIEREYNDIIAVVRMINRTGFSLVTNDIMIEEKIKKVNKHYEHSKMLGRVR